MVSPPLKDISQNGIFPQIGVKIKHIFETTTQFYIPFISRWNNNLLIGPSPLIHPQNPRTRDIQGFSRFFRYRGTETHTARTKRFSPWSNFSMHGGSIRCTAGKPETENGFTGWWLNQPNRKIWSSKSESSPRFGVKIRNISNHHLGLSCGCCGVFLRETDP